jgi:hypothetical protein
MTNGSKVITLTGMKKSRFFEHFIDISEGQIIMNVCFSLSKILALRTAQRRIPRLRIGTLDSNVGGEWFIRTAGSRVISGLFTQDPEEACRKSYIFRALKPHAIKN